MPRLHPPPHWARPELYAALTEHRTCGGPGTQLPLGSADQAQRGNCLGQKEAEGTPEGNSCRCRGYPGPRGLGPTSWSGKWVQTLAVQRECKDAAPCHDSSQATLACPTLLCTLSGSVRDTGPLGSGKCCPLRVRTSASGFIFPTKWSVTSKVPQSTHLLPERHLRL